MILLLASAPLSRLPNRTHCLDRLRAALDAARGKRSVAVLFLDLDSFKVVDDSLGHHVGDPLLVAVADRLQRCPRPSDSVARLGGLLAADPPWLARVRGSLRDPDAA